MKLSAVSVKYPSFRDDLMKGSYKWLEGKRLDDNAEGMWRIHDKLYDLKDFTIRHPGGKEWLELTEGCDITEQFETHHITNKAEQMLSKFYVREATLPRNYKFTFNDDGFYRTIKRKVAARIDKLDQAPATTSEFYFNFILSSTFLFSILAARYHNYYIAIAAGFLLMWLTTISHNFIHQKNNWRMYFISLSLMSWRDFRVFHAMSHHLYPNTYHDLEISLFEPWLVWMPQSKTAAQKVFSWIISPVVYATLFAFGFINRLLGIFKSSKRVLYWDDLLMLSIPLAMWYIGKSTLHSIIPIWFTIIFASSFFYGFVAINAGHHGPEIFHEGDEVRSLDFGIYQMGVTIDRIDAKQCQFMVLTNFGDHILHHFFPTLDHGLLPQLNDVFRETCEEFDTQLREKPWHQLIAGQFQQLSRTEITTLKKKNE